MMVVEMIFVTAREENGIQPVGEWVEREYAA